MPYVPSRGTLVGMLVGFPLLYQLNSVSPWSRAFFVEGERPYFFAVFGGIAALHWLTAAVTWWLLRRSGVSGEQVGLRIAPARAAVLAMLLVGVGLSVVGARALLGPAEPLARIPPAGLALTTAAERTTWIFLSLSAGFCEEFVYRGAAMTLLRRRGVRTAWAVLASTLSWTLIHGAGAFAAAPGYLAVGLGFAGLYLWRRSLVPVVVVHTLVDLSVLAS